MKLKLLKCGKRGPVKEVFKNYLKEKILILILKKLSGVKIHQFWCFYVQFWRGTIFPIPVHFSMFLSGTVLNEISQKSQGQCFPDLGLYKLDHSRCLDGTVVNYLSTCRIADHNKELISKVTKRFHSGCADMKAFSIREITNKYS